MLILHKLSLWCWLRITVLRSKYWLSDYWLRWCVCRLYARVDLGILSDITEMHQTTEQRQERVAEIRAQLEEQISNMENFIFRVGSRKLNNWSRNTVRVCMYIRWLGSRALDYLLRARGRDRAILPQICRTFATKLPRGHNSGSMC